MQQLGVTVPSPAGNSSDWDIHLAEGRAVVGFEIPETMDAGVTAVDSSKLILQQIRGGCMLDGGRQRIVKKDRAGRDSGPA